MGESQKETNEQKKERLLQEDRDEIERLVPRLKGTWLHGIQGYANSNDTFAFVGYQLARSEERVKGAGELLRKMREVEELQKVNETLRANNRKANTEIRNKREQVVRLKETLGEVRKELDYYRSATGAPNET